ncbi:MAG: hypothetical protein F6J93_03190 [Oscillatoria sp. SIO1A7]|nr:hypothetical protein [Oscillatoria sp. SIO1A7]
MDPSTLSALLTLVTPIYGAIAGSDLSKTAVSSVYGNRTDGLFCWIVGKTWDFFTKGEENVSPQLQRAARKAYLETFDFSLQFPMPQNCYTIYNV